MDDMSISKSLTARSVVLGNVFSKLIGRFLWLVSLCGAPFKTMDLLPDMMFDGMVFQKKYEKGWFYLFVIGQNVGKTQLNLPTRSVGFGKTGVRQDKRSMKMKRKRMNLTLTS